MGIKEDIEALYARLATQVDLSEAVIDKTMADLECMDPAQFEVLCMKLGVDISDKRRAATLVAILRQAPAFLIAFGLMA